MLFTFSTGVYGLPMIELAATVNRIFGSPLGQLAFFAFGLIRVGGALFASVHPRQSPSEDNEGAGQRYRRFAMACVGVLVVSLFIVFACVKHAANREIDAALHSGVVSVLIDDVALQQPETFVKALANPCATGFHRSHPETKHDVLILTRSGVLTLKIGQDSRVASDYWIFYPDFWLTQTNEVRRACNTGLLLE
ncbi:hypothetical protein [Massilia suwonensis]|uniref:Uncharacterized protein n=1 Tax=Massilia suwonensis TaxID=648895 RepID=A0ABW0MLI0_9BURK